MYRDQFPVTERLIYLNHAAVSPCAAPRRRPCSGWRRTPWISARCTTTQWLETYEGLRRCGGTAGEWRRATKSPLSRTRRKGSRPSPWARLACRATGSSLSRRSFPRTNIPGEDWNPKELRRMASGADSLDAIDAGGAGRASARDQLRPVPDRLSRRSERDRRDLPSAGRDLSRGRDSGPGRFPARRRAAHIDALAADGHKWLMGPEGCGILYISKTPSGNGRAGGIWLDQRRRLQRLRQPRYGAAPGQPPWGGPRGRCPTARASPAPVPITLLEVSATEQPPGFGLGLAGQDRLQLRPGLGGPPHTQERPGRPACRGRPGRRNDRARSGRDPGRVGTIRRHPRRHRDRPDGAEHHASPGFPAGLAQSARRPGPPPPGDGTG